MKTILIFLLLITPAFGKNYDFVGFGKTHDLALQDALNKSKQFKNQDELKKARLFYGDKPYFVKEEMRGYIKIRFEVED